MNRLRRWWMWKWAIVRYVKPKTVLKFHGPVTRTEIWEIDPNYRRR